MASKKTASMLEERLREWAAARGYALAIAGAGVIEAVREKLEERKSAGPKCVVMVAVPSPIQVLPFTVEGKKIDALIPPTYVRYNATFADVLGDMKENAPGLGSGQQVCPENKGRLKIMPSGVEFTGEETEAVLEAGRMLAAGDRGGDVSVRGEALALARAKFERLGMSEDLEVMGRNLDYFLVRR